MAIEVPNVGIRIAAVQSLVGGIRPMHGKGRRQVPAKIVSRQGSSVVAATENDKSGADSYRDWIFRTSLDKVWAHYSEEWIPDNKQWSLKQTALHIYTVESPNSRNEIFAFHCEPSHQGGTVSDRCKRGPHAHVTALTHELNHAHIPMQLVGLDDSLESLESLTSLFQTAIEVIEAEILPRARG
ncbi:MAG: hypothetical protein R3C59_10905 [Planctomycetaceae bacterium]